MKIHFTASVAGKKLYRENDLRIVTQIRKLGYPLTEMILDKERVDMENLTREELEKNYFEVSKNIEMADLLVAEVSYSSSSVGFEVMTALRKSKMVLLLHVPSNHASLLETMKDKNLYVCEYTLENLEEVIGKVLGKLEKKISERFNFFLPKSLLSKLEIAAEKKGVNKSEFIRGLIEKDMKRNKI